MFKYNQNSFVHWCIVLSLGWMLLGIVIGIPIHIALGIPLPSVGVFFAIQCILNIVASPWLFSARATTDNPKGQPFRFAVALIVWLTAASVAASLQILNGDFANRTAVAAFLGTPIFLGSISLLALRQFQKRRNTVSQ